MALSVGRIVVDQLVRHPVGYGRASFARPCRGRRRSREPPAVPDCTAVRTGPMSQRRISRIIAGSVRPRNEISEKNAKPVRADVERRPAPVDSHEAGSEDTPWHRASARARVGRCYATWITPPVAARRLPFARKCVPHAPRVRSTSGRRCRAPRRRAGSATASHSDRF